MYCVPRSRGSGATSVQTDLPRWAVEPGGRGCPPRLYYLVPRPPRPSAGTSSATSGVGGRDGSVPHENLSGVPGSLLRRVRGSPGTRPVSCVVDRGGHRPCRWGFSARPVSGSVGLWSRVRTRTGCRVGEDPRVPRPYLCGEDPVPSSDRTEVGPQGFGTRHLPDPVSRPGVRPGVV